MLLDLFSNVSYGIAELWRKLFKKVISLCKENDLLQPATDVADVNRTLMFAFSTMVRSFWTASVCCFWLAKVHSDTYSLPSIEKGQLIYLTAWNVSELLTLKRTAGKTCLTGTRKDVGVLSFDSYWWWLYWGCYSHHGNYSKQDGWYLTVREQHKLLSEGWM